MGHFLLYLFVVAACLLWSATFTAAAARTRLPWLRLLLAVAGVLVPVVALAPLVWFTAVLAFGRHMPTNWFGPTLTAAASALVGGLWIAWAGLARAHHAPLPFSSEPVPLAAGWPAVGLAALFAMATGVAFGTLLVIDNAIAAQAPYLRLEAGQLMQANLPAAVPDSHNAAPLYRQAFAAIEADAGVGGQESPLAAATTSDVASPAVTDLLARHAGTLDLLRRAADRDTCRFQRDWTRPSVDMLLPELQSLRTAARLVTLAARREAADGDAAEALRDVVRLQRIARHAAAEPILISHLVGLAIDTLALDTLAQVLPTLRPDDLALLDAPGIRDLVTAPPATGSHFYGEEAFGLSVFAAFSEGRYGPADIGLEPPRPRLLFRFLPFSLLYRVFFLPADLAGYRSIMQQYQATASRSEPYPEAKSRLDGVEAGLRDRCPGMISAQIVPALVAVFRQQERSVSLHRAAAALVAATRQRLETGRLPAAFDDLAAKALPPASRDPFTTDRPLVMKRAGEAIVVYSVGPDGEDDGGPVAPGADAVAGNDDVGLRMAVIAP